MNDPEDPGGHRQALAGIADEQTLPVDTDHLQRIANRALAGLGISAELSIALVDAPRVAALNTQYYGGTGPTDVLSFPMDGPSGSLLGDVVLCPEYAIKQAKGMGVSLDDELAHLLVHGIVHLTGRDHATPADEVAMARDERRLLGLA